MAAAVPLASETADAGNLALIEAETDSAVTYGELAERIGQVASAIGRACGPRALVACELSRTIDDVVWYLGALAGGHVVLLVDPAAPVERKAQLYDRFRPHLRPPFPTDGASLLVAGRDQVLGNGPGLQPHPDLFLLLSTSGSTASPKLVRLSRDAVISNAVAIAAALELDAGERAMANLPLSFSYGLSVLHSHLAAGASTVLSQSTIAQRPFWDSLFQHECTSIAGVPATYQALVRLRLLDRLGSVRTLTQAGGRLDLDTAGVLRDHAQSAGRRFVVMYGQTEATARITVLPPSELGGRFGSVGQPIQGSISIVADPQAEDATGEICYEGRNVMMGYAERAEDLSAPDGLQSRLLTGDVGRLDADGYLYLTGRRSRIAKVEGYRLNLDEIESALAPIGEFRAVEVEGSVILAHEPNDVAVGPVDQVLSNTFNLHPRSWKLSQVERLPLTGNGKVDLAALLSMVSA
jgi:acyl-CoA synthetase (AMP-forming)/AMP-acid ligase II